MQGQPIVAPNSLPIPAVAAIASAPQKATRAAPFSMSAPPVRAPIAPSSAVADQSASGFAKSLLEAPGDDAGRVREAYRRVYSRPPAPAETDRVLKFLAASDASTDAKKFLQQAADKYEKCYQDFRTILAGQLARIKQGQCYQDMGDTRRALGLYADILGQPDDIAEFRKLKASALYLSMQCWLSEGEKKYELAALKGEEWLQTGRTGEDRQPDWLAIDEYLISSLVIKYVYAYLNKFMALDMAHQNDVAKFFEILWFQYFRDPTMLDVRPDIPDPHDALGLSAEQTRLLERLHLDFVMAGARLKGDSRARYAQVMEQLATLTTRFGQNVLHDESSYQLILKTEDDLAGLPDFVRAAARQAAVDRGRARRRAVAAARGSDQAGDSGDGRGWVACVGAAWAVTSGAVSIELAMATAPARWSPAPRRCCARRRAASSRARRS